MTQLNRSAAVFAALTTAGQALVAKAGTDATALAQANDALANVDATVVGMAQPVLDIINGALPTPVAVADTSTVDAAAPAGDATSADTVNGTDSITA